MTYSCFPFLGCGCLSWQKKPAMILGRGSSSWQKKPKPASYDFRITTQTFAGEKQWAVDIEVPSDAESPEVLKRIHKAGEWSKSIAFTGQFNVGKTMLLSMICRRSLPSGDMVSTEGISGVFMKDKGMLFLDSAGTDHIQPQNFASMEADCAEETKENLVSTAVVNLSSVFVHVVGKLTRPTMRTLWVHLSNIQRTNGCDLTVLYNLYPHEKNMDVVRKQADEIMDGYGNQVDHREDWQFITESDGVQVHHWFFLDNNWSSGHEINEQQIKFLWTHLAALSHTPKDKSKSTLEVIERSLLATIPNYVEPSGLSPTLVFQESPELVASNSSQDYNVLGKFKITLPDDAQMQNPKLFLDGAGRLKPGNDGFHPAVRIFESIDKSEHVILIDAPNCVYADVAAPGQGKIEIEQDCRRGAHSCTRIKITKIPYLKAVAACGADAVAEESGIFEYYYPPDTGSGMSGPLVFRSAECTEGQLTVRMKVLEPGTLQ